MPARHPTHRQAYTGQLKKGVPAATAARTAAAAASRHEWLLFALTAINVTASLLAPCGLVLSNKVRWLHAHVGHASASQRGCRQQQQHNKKLPCILRTRLAERHATPLLPCPCGAQANLLPCFALTMISIIVCMKLVTYAHCNTTLRRAARAAALASSSGATTDAAAAAAPPAGATDAAAAGGGDVPPTPFLTAAKVAGAGAGGGAAPAKAGEVAFPGNLVPGDMAYFLLAPTLTYQVRHGVYGAALL